MRKSRMALAVAGVLALALVGTPAGASDDVDGDHGGDSPAAMVPETIALPNGFAPEGVVFGYGPVLYAGSLVDGAIYAANARTGEGHVLVEGQPDRKSTGLEFDDRTGRLYVSGGATGHARVYDAATGTELTDVVLGTAPTFVNDVALTDDAAWFTDSNQPVLHKMSLADPTQFEDVPLGGEFVFEDGVLNANGIVTAPDGSLFVVHSSRGELYRVDPATGDATLVDLGGASLVNGDGMVLEGDGPLFVIQNRINQVSVIDLADDLVSGSVVDVLTDDRFRVPTTGDLYGGALYAVNARFGTTPGPDVDYDVVRVTLPDALLGGHGQQGWGSPGCSES